MFSKLAKPISHQQSLAGFPFTSEAMLKLREKR